MVLLTWSAPIISAVSLSVFYFNFWIDFIALMLASWNTLSFKIGYGTVVNLSSILILEKRDSSSSESFLLYFVDSDYPLSFIKTFITLSSLFLPFYINTLLFTRVLNFYTTFMKAIL